MRWTVVLSLQLFALIKAQIPIKLKKTRTKPIKIPEYKPGDLRNQLPTARSKPEGHEQFKGSTGVIEGGLLDHQWEGESTGAFGGGLQIGSGSAAMGGGVGMVCGACDSVVWSSGSIPGANHQITEQVETWWTGGTKCLEQAGVICSDLDDRNAMIIKVTHMKAGRTKRIYFKVISTKEYIMWAQSTRGIKRFGKFQKIMLAKIDQYFGHGIIHWEHRGSPLWGLVNSQGYIINFGESEDFTYSLNRLFINYLVKTYVIGKGSIVTKLKLYWDKKWKVIKVPESPEVWMICTWLDAKYRRVLWRVVTIGTLIRIEYIGPNPDQGIVKIVIKTFKRTFTYFVKMDRLFIFWTRKRSSKKWTSVALYKLSKRLQLSIIHWKHFDKVYWGLVNKKGEIVAFGLKGEGPESRYTETVTRIYALYLMKTKVIEKGYRIKWYKMFWQGIEVFRSTTVDVKTLLIPDWLGPSHSGSIWIVVKHMAKIVIVYVGTEVTGPRIKGCGEDDDPYFSEEEDSDDFGECKYASLHNATLPKVVKPGKSGWCKALNSRGRCTDQINPGGHCACNQKCECIDPYRWFQRHAHLPAEVVRQITVGPGGTGGSAVEVVPQITVGPGGTGGGTVVIPSGQSMAAFRGEEGKSRLKKRGKKSNKRSKKGRANRGSKRG